MTSRYRISPRCAARHAVAAVAALLFSSSAASAAPIGLFSWQEVFFGEYTLAVDVFDAWADTGIELQGASVTFEQSDGTGGVASFAGYSAANVQELLTGDFQADCAATPAAIGAASGSVQVPGYAAARETATDAGSLCLGFLALPQDIVSATLNFSYDLSLGTVTVAALGTPFDNPVREILFTAAPAPAPVPEPSTLVCVALGLAGLAARRRRRRVASRVRGSTRRDAGISHRFR